MRDILCFTLSFFNKETTVGGITETVEFVYNLFNQLIQFKDKDGNITNYVYDGNGKKVQKSYSDTVIKYYWSGDYVINETISSVTNPNDIKNVSNYIDSSGIFGREAGEDYYQYLKDNHGDVVETRKNGTSYTVYYYGAFGYLENADFTNENPMGYVGEYFDTESGLIYLRNRYYDPNIGRFISEDTYWNPNNMIYGDKEYKEGEIKFPDASAIIQSSNLYAYCMNNPIIYHDPTGEAIETIADIISIGLSAKDLIVNPSWANFGFLAWDVASTILPAIPGSYTYKTAKVVKGVSGLKKFTRYNFRKNLTTLVGNAPKWMGKAEAHHVLPVKFENWFKKNGIESIHDPRFGSWVNKTSHQKWSNDYNKKWSNFIEKTPNASANKIIEYARKLSEEYGFDLNF